MIPLEDFNDEGEDEDEDGDEDDDEDDDKDDKIRYISGKLVI